MVIKFYIIIYMSFLDIWNNLLKFNEKNIFIVFDKDGNIWFGMKDLFRALGYTSLKLIVNDFGVPANYVTIYKYIKVPSYNMVPLNIQPHTKLTKSSKT